MNDRGGREKDLPKLAESLRLEVDDLLPAVDASRRCWALREVGAGRCDDHPMPAREFATAGVRRPQPR